ncbi:MAG: hypothetical protein HF976_11950 [ANME-2 cluster archaeon]|nr:hypothetical protein [ANME-2 cluster archaeon]MBC2702096.1 hypothetical protein [ANME-2 cluster archaeon]MBC2706761.1 hypothetical protein [ANME-2 cluster archaeon]MBC2747662.1 hypothetical protein [ANME-2 cluster archaeon]MBC2762965.1 hypothetical protein [ANME-2 cluster archaeon]
MPAGQGRGSGSGTGSGRGSGMGRGGGRQHMGPPKECKCPGCGYTSPHQPGQPCANQACPKCGTNMVGM